MNLQIDWAQLQNKYLLKSDWNIASVFGIQKTEFCDHTRKILVDATLGLMNRPHKKHGSFISYASHPFCL